jgi:RNA polymerase sigma-70 factor (ECF subfamily)
MLRSRRCRREDPLAAHLPDLVAVPDGDLDPEQQALLGDSVSLALLIVLDQLTPAERLVFVLHDMFELPFEDIASIAGRRTATRQPGTAPRGRCQNSITRSGSSCSSHLRCLQP